MHVQDRYRPQLMTANSTYRLASSHIGGFLCTVSGTLTVTDGDGTVLLNQMPISSGIYLPLPFFMNTQQGGSVTLAGGAAGTLLI